MTLPHWGCSSLTSFKLTFLFPVTTAASSKEATTNPTSALRGFPEDVRTLFKDIPLLGTNNLTFSDLASKGVFDDEPSAVAAAAQHFTSTSCQADWDKCGSGMSYPYSSQVLELFHLLCIFFLRSNMVNDEYNTFICFRINRRCLVSRQNFWMNLSLLRLTCRIWCKRMTVCCHTPTTKFLYFLCEDEPRRLPTFLSSNIIVRLSSALTVRNGSCSVSNKTVFQGDIEAAPRYVLLQFLYF